MPRAVVGYRPYGGLSTKRKYEIAMRAGRAIGSYAKNYYKKRKTAVKPVSRTAYANTPHQNPLNAQAKKASMSRKGRKNVRSIVHRRKRVKVSKPLRKKIQKVIDGQSYKGTYHATRFGTVGVTTTGNGGTSNTVSITETQGGYTAQNAYFEVNRDFDGNTRFWFSHALQATAGTTAQKLEQGSEWQFFTPLKVLDAASVLWNSKTAARDYANQTGNLNSVHQEATGAPVVGTQTNPQIKGLKVMIDNAYVKFTLKNNSQRAMKIEVYNCVPKIKFPESTALSAFNAALVREVDGANSAYISAVGEGFTSLQQEEAALFNPAVQPNMIKAFSESYKYEKITLKIAPGETCQHSVQGPKGYLLDYRKLYNAGTNEQEKAYKGTSMFVMMAVMPDLAFATSGMAVGQQAGHSGHFGPGTAAIDSLADPVSIQWDEVYRLSIPELVGFKTAAGAAGTMQVLNKRIPRRAFANFTRMTSQDGNPGYQAFEEENPVTGINAGLFN